MTPFAQLEKSAYRGRAFAHGAVDAIDAFRQLLTRRGGGAVKAMHGFADKLPGKALGDSVFDPLVQSADKWRAAGVGATAGAVGGTAGVGINNALRDLGVYKNRDKVTGADKDRPQLDGVTRGGFAAGSDAAKTLTSGKPAMSYEDFRKIMEQHRLQPGQRGRGLNMGGMQ